MLTVTHAEVLQGSHNVEDSPSPKRVTAVRGDNVGDSVRDGVAVDAKRQH